MSTCASGCITLFPVGLMDPELRFLMLATEHEASPFREITIVWSFLATAVSQPMERDRLLYCVRNVRRLTLKPPSVADGIK